MVECVDDYCYGDRQCIVAVGLAGREYVEEMVSQLEPLQIEIKELSSLGVLMLSYNRPLLEDPYDERFKRMLQDDETLKTEAALSELIK